MPYCPFKMMVRMYKREPGQLLAAGTYNMEDECDRGNCGFWSRSNESCGIAALGSASLPQPMAPEKEKETGEVLKPQVTA